MVDPDSHRISRVLWYSGTLSRVRSVSLTGLSPSLIGLSRPIQLLNRTVALLRALQPHKTEVLWFGLYPVRSPLLGVSRIDFFSFGY